MSFRGTFIKILSLILFVSATLLITFLTVKDISAETSFQPTLTASPTNVSADDYILVSWSNMPSLPADTKISLWRYYSDGYRTGYSSAGSIYAGSCGYTPAVPSTSGSCNFKTSSTIINVSNDGRFVFTLGTDINTAYKSNDVTILYPIYYPEERFYSTVKIFSYADTNCNAKFDIGESPEPMMFILNEGKTYNPATGVALGNNSGEGRTTFNDVEANKTYLVSANTSSTSRMPSTPGSVVINPTANEVINLEFGFVQYRTGTPSCSTPRIDTGGITQNGVTQNTLKSDGQTVYSLNMTASGQDSVSKINNIYGVVNYNGPDFRGALAVSRSNFDAFQIDGRPPVSKISCGNGWEGGKLNGLGSQYIEIKGCQVLSSGDQFIAKVDFTLDPQFTAPQSNIFSAVAIDNFNQRSVAKNIASFNIASNVPPSITASPKNVLAGDNVLVKWENIPSLNANSKIYLWKNYNDGNRTGYTGFGSIYAGSCGSTPAIPLTSGSCNFKTSSTAINITNHGTFFFTIGNEFDYTYKSNDVTILYSDNLTGESGDLRFRIAEFNGKNPTGRYVNGATVKLIKKYSQTSFATQNSSNKNGEDGWVWFDSIPTGDYEILAYKEGFEGVWKQSDCQIGASGGSFDNSTIKNTMTSDLIAAWDDFVRVTNSQTTVCQDLGLAKPGWNAQKGEVAFRIAEFEGNNWANNFINDATVKLTDTSGNTVIAEQKSSFFSNPSNPSGGEKGWVHFFDIPVGTYGVMAYKEGHKGVWKQVDCTVGGSGGSFSDATISNQNTEGKIAAFDNLVEVKANTVAVCQDLGLDDLQNTSFGHLRMRVREFDQNGVWTGKYLNDIYVGINGTKVINKNGDVRGYRETSSNKSGQDGWVWFDYIVADYYVFDLYNLGYYNAITKEKYQIVWHQSDCLEPGSGTNNDSNNQTATVGGGVVTVCKDIGLKKVSGQVSLLETARVSTDSASIFDDVKESSSAIVGNPSPKPTTEVTIPLPSITPSPTQNPTATPTSAPTSTPTPLPSPREATPSATPTVSPTSSPKEEKISTDSAQKTI